MTDRFGHLYLDVNPKPWAVGPLALGRRGGKMFPKMERNASVFAFKEAVREEVEGLRVDMLPEGSRYILEFYFWRRLESYIGESGRKATAHVADATNLQKSTEDALQGLLFANDRDVQVVKSTIVEQGPDVIPGIGIYYDMLDEEPHVDNGILVTRSWVLARRTRPRRTTPGHHHELFAR